MPHHQPQRARQQPGRRELERLLFLMRYLRWHSGSALPETIDGVRENLGYTIPPGVPDPQGRMWRDPVAHDLSTVIHAAPLDRPRVTGFSLYGTGLIAGLGVHSCGHAPGGGLCWTTAFEFPPRGRIEALAFDLTEALWSHPDWRAVESFDFCWLEPLYPGDPRDRG